VASANVELVRSIFAAWERGDFSSAEWAHPEIEFVLADLPERGSWKGVSEMAAAWRNWLGAWKELRVAADEYSELDNERVLVLSHYSGGRAKASGVDTREMRTNGAAILSVRDRKVTRMVLYLYRDQALADLGLGPEAGSRS
jgi:ketosteroid isomerase-like protein